MTTLRVPFDGNKRVVERLRGAKRKLYRRYLGWTNDQNLCGSHAERVVLDSLQASQTRAGIWVPDQTVGEIYEIDGIPVEPGPLDALAYVLDLDTVARKAALVVEVKNVRHWLYPWAPEVWQFLAKSARLAIETDTVAVLVAPHLAWQTYLAATDVGFLACPYRLQLFNPAIPDVEFDEVVSEFGLTITRHGGPLDTIVNWFAKFLRQGPKNDDEPAEFSELCDQQANRLALTAPIILEHEHLAGDLDGDSRRSTFSHFKMRLAEVVGWDLRKGY